MVKELSRGMHTGIEEPIEGETGREGNKIESGLVKKPLLGCTWPCLAALPDRKPTKKILRNALRRCRELAPSEE